MSSSANYIERPSSPVRNSLSDMNEELSKANMHEHGPDLYPDGTPMPLHITSRPDYDPRAYVFLEPELPPPTATHTEVHEYLTKRFCRSMCLSWHEAAAEASGLPVDGHGLYAMSYVHCVKLYGRYHDLCLWEDVQWSPKLPVRLIPRPFLFRS